ncbi:hypothetical protein NP493_222g06003 [Ridgeia piscesae]|uniref:Uncharacterized protein n=1 Tax=Ridgeia piscesae TaxID=27915 RepID=A0AAD9UDY4_RIDPI|nr:hypothetical protein NP493_222g06003 [Ridgeia piscesae]
MEKSYLFVIRRDENIVLYHPLLPAPPSDGSALVLEIGMLEREADKQGIIAQMKRLPIGFALGLGYQTKTAGNVYMDGIRTEPFNALYYWESFSLGRNISTTSFTICAVLYEVLEALLSISVPSSGTPFIYHYNFDKYAARTCKYFKRSAISDTTGLKLGMDAFINPITSYLGVKEGSVDYAPFFKPLAPGETQKKTRFQENVVESVEISHRADLEWIWSQKRNSVTYAVWRYIGLAFGVFRFYPSVRLPKRFNVKDTHW